MELKPITITDFKGLNEVRDALNTEPGTLSAARNVMLTREASIKTREGYSRVDDGTTQAYFTRSGNRGYMVKDGSLYTIDTEGRAGALLASGVGTGQFYWEEMGDAIILSGPSYLIIRGLSVQRFSGYRSYVAATPTEGSLEPGTYQVLGRSTTTEEALSTPTELQLTAESGKLGIMVHNPGTDALDVYATGTNGGTFYYVGELPAGETLHITSPVPQAGVFDNNLLAEQGFPLADRVAWFQGRVWRSQYVPSADTTFILPSKAFAPGICDYKEYAPIPGEVTLLAAQEDIMVIGTRRRIYGFDGKTLRVLHEAGCIPHTQFAHDAEQRVWFWTKDGMARASPFELVTYDSVRDVKASSVAVQRLRDPEGDQIVAMFKESS